MSSCINGLTAKRASKRPRQDPISCSFCRSKKLKCNRRHPCSNCTARGVTCDSKNRYPVELVSSPSSGIEDDTSVLARLRHLEKIVLGSKQDIPSEAATSTLRPSQALERTDADGAWAPSASKYDEALHTLEEVGFGEYPAHSVTAQQLSITYNISTTLLDVISRQNPGSTTVLLPPKKHALLMLDQYLSYATGLQHIVHAPTVRTMAQSVYADLSQGRPIVHSHVALLFSIFASTTALQSSCVSELGHDLFAEVDTKQASKVWAHAALEVLEYSRCTSSGSLEDVQASIILGFLLYHIEGFSARPRALFATAIAVARDISLHKIDLLTGNRNTLGPGANAIETEIKRRVWWYLASTDWLLALSGGPQEGTYFIQPRQMRVNPPRNVNDEDLIYTDPPVNLPLSEFTTMSYYIQRTKLAHICRNVVDLMPLTNADLSTIEYREVIGLDRMFQSFFEDMPAFLRTDEKSRIESAHVTARYAATKVQRYGLEMMAHVRRCKLHQPFLIRRSLAGDFSYSRDASLESARTVLRVKKLADEETGPTISATVNLTFLVHHVFLATIVLVMDLCFNKAEGGDDDRKAEVRDACKMLEEAATQSDIASKFINSLMDVLRTHQVRLYASGDAADRPRPVELMATTRPMEGAERDIHQVTQQTADPWLVQENFQNHLSDFDEIWRDYVEFGPNMDMPEWDSLFSDLNSQL